MAWNSSQWSVKVRKKAKIRNRYNQAPHLTQDTNGNVTTSQLDIINESQEVSPFPAGDHKASTNRRAWKHYNKTRQKQHKWSTKETLFSRKIKKYHRKKSSLFAAAWSWICHVGYHSYDVCSKAQPIHCHCYPLLRLFYSAYYILASLCGRNVMGVPYTQEPTFAHFFQQKIWGSEYFLMIRIQNMCGKAILMCLNRIVVGVIHDARPSLKV